MTKHGLFSFHIVDESPWPLFMSLGVFSCMLSFLESIVMMKFIVVKLLLSFLFSCLSFLGWTRDISSEGGALGMHTLLVQKGLKAGFLLFIVSEVMFFSSIFWSLFYFSFAPNENLGVWPSTGLLMVNPLSAPLLGTMLLMSSGFSITWSHYSMMNGNKSQALLSLVVTILLGTAFTGLQVMEYMENFFTISDSVFGSLFYLSTGFHGAHVIVGTIYLTVCLMRLCLNKMSKLHHLGFEFAIWYWHFVDVVWMVLFLSLYL